MWPAAIMSLFAAKKIVKEKGQDPEAFELDVAQVGILERSAEQRCTMMSVSALGLPSICDSQALCDLEANSNDLKAELRELYITSAKGLCSAIRNEPLPTLRLCRVWAVVDVTGCKAVVIFVPFKLLKVVHKIQSRLVRELEKKFSGKHVVLIGQRRIMRKPSAGQRQPKQKRPRSRTLTVSTLCTRLIWCLRCCPLAREHACEAHSCLA